MTESKTKKTIRNAIWGIMYNVLIAFLPFVARTILIRTLGMEYVGVGSLFTSILSVLSLAELGISESIIFSLYKPIAEKDDEKVCALLNFYRKAYRIIGAIILIIGLALLIKIDVFVKGGYPADMNLRILFIIYLVNTVASYFTYAYLSVLLTANHRNDIDYKISCIVCLVRDIIQIIVLIWFRNYYIYIIFLPIMTIVHNVIRASSVKKMYPQIKCRGEVDAETKGVIKKQVGGLMIGKITVASRNSLDSIVLSSMLGLTSVAVYGNYYCIMKIVYGFLIYFSAAMRGGIGNNVATHSAERNFEDMLTLSNLFWWLYSICTVLLFCLYQPFMKWWVGDEFTYGFPLVVLFSSYFYLLCNFMIFSQYTEAKGLYWENKLRYILEAVSNLVLNIVLVKFFDVYGIVLATVLSVLFLTNVYGPIIGFKHFFVNCSKRRYFIQQIVNFAITVLGCVVAYGVCYFIKIEGLIGLCLKAVTAFVVGISLFFGLKFKTKDFRASKKYLFDRLKHIR